MRYHVSLQVEAVFHAAIGVLWVNDDVQHTSLNTWMKVQSILEKRNPA